MGLLAQMGYFQPGNAWRMKNGACVGSITLAPAVETASLVDWYSFLLWDISERMRKDHLAVWSAKWSWMRVTSRSVPVPERRRFLLRWLRSTPRRRSR